MRAEDPETRRRLHQSSPIIPDPEKLTENEKKKRTRLLIKRLRQQLSVVKKKVKTMSIELQEFKAEAKILGDRIRENLIEIVHDAGEKEVQANVVLDQVISFRISDRKLNTCLYCFIIILKFTLTVEKL